MLKVPLERMDEAKQKPKGKKRRMLLWSLLILLIIGLVIPESPIIPVKNGSSNDWNHQAFWYEPWGTSGVHKGIDIFAQKGTNLLSSTKGVVLYTGELKLGGKVIIVLGPKWRVHYYAHLDQIETRALSFVGAAKKIGTVGDSGNAVGKQPHVHYSIVTLLPYFWRVDFDSQGWKKMFYLNPHQQLMQSAGDWSSDDS